MRTHMRLRSALVMLLLAAASGTAAAQPVSTPFEIGAHVATARSGEFDATEVGLGVRGAWRPSPLLGLEAEIDLYPGDFPGRAGFSGRRVEGLLGATVGPRIGRLRPFGRARAGFLRFGPATDPPACIAIFPPPLQCTLSTGRTAFALDLGGGVEGSLSTRTFWRVDAGDRLVRYPGPTLDRGFRARGGFFGHDLRITIGAGMRF